MSTFKQKPANKPTHAIHQVIGEGEKARWFRVGSGWMHGDMHGLNLKFDSIPTHGRIVLRAVTDKQNGAAVQGGAA
ncbi:MAG: hypothetical protein AB7E70_09615 [Hyphomicrobiaceae bacterium]